MTAGHAGRPRVVVCSTTAAVEAEAGADVKQTMEGAAVEGSDATRRPRRGGNRAPRSRASRQRRAGPNRELQVHSDSVYKACAYVALTHLQKHSSMKAVALDQGGNIWLLKALALAQRAMLADGKCIAMLDMQPVPATGGMRVSLALAGAQPLCSGTELRIKRSFSVDTTARIIVGKVASGEPVYLLAAGQAASEVALLALARAQTRLGQLGFRTAVLPAFQKGPDHPVVAAGGFERLPGPTTAPDGGVEGGEAAAAGGLTRSTPEDSAMGALSFSVVLVEDAGAPPPAPSPEPSWVRREGRMTDLAGADLEGPPEGAASRRVNPDDDSEAAATGTVTLEVTQKVQHRVLAEQILEEVRQKGSVKLAVDPRACGLSLRALQTAGQSFQAPTRLLCDLAPSSRDGTYMINATAASSLPVPPRAPPAPDAPDSPDAPAATEGQPKPLGPLRVAAGSNAGAIAEALRLRLRVDGGAAAVQCAYGQSSVVAFAALVEARDQLQTSARLDLGFAVEQCEITVQDKQMMVARLLVDTWPL